MNDHSKIIYELSYYDNNILIQEKKEIFNNLKNYLFIFNKYFKYKNKLHNIDKPSFKFDKYEYFSNNGKLHRLNGPAYNNGKYKGYYINGIAKTKIDFKNETSHEICKLCFGFCNQKCFL